MKNLIRFIPYIAKSIVGAVVSGGLLPIASAIAENAIVWKWEYMLITSLGVGISVYLIPNKEKVD